MEIRLRKLQLKDAKGMLEWINDVEIQKCFRFADGGKTREEAEAFICCAQTIPSNGGSVHFAVSNAEDEYLGTISLKHFDFTAGHAEYAIALRKKAQGKGIAAKATDQLMALAFTEFGLEKVYLNVLADNFHAISCYEAYGFVCEGEFCRHVFLRGEYKNLRWYRLLKEEYLMLKKQGREENDRR